MDNMIIYNQVRVTPETAKSAITDGKLKGKTDINPMFRIETLTKVFGPVGIGWYYDVTRIENLVIPEKQEIACFVDINLYYKWEGEWSKPVFGTGGSMLLDNFRTMGLKTNDDGYKMALTDAISVAAKELGVSADVYWKAGETKYNRPAPPPEPVEGTKVEKASINKFVQDKAVVTQECADEEYQRRRKIIASLMKEMKKTNADYVKDAHGFDMKTATTQEFTQFERDLSNKWLAS